VFLIFDSIPLCSPARILYLILFKLFYKINIFCFLSEKKISFFRFQGDDDEECKVTKMQDASLYFSR